MSDRMPHAISPHDVQDELDDRLIQQAILADVPDGSTRGLDFSRELEPGEKADDAVNYEDISDDDLADDEDEKAPKLPTQPVVSDPPLEGLESFINDEETPDLTKSDGVIGDEFDDHDLFGDLLSSPPREGGEAKNSQPFIDSVGMGGLTEPNGEGHNHNNDESLLDLPDLEAQGSPGLSSQPIFRPVNFSAKDIPLSRDQQMQEKLFAMSGSSFGGTDILPPPPENQEELLKSLWPKFRRDAIPNFMDLLPPKMSHYVGKKPLKRPRPVQPTKVNLDIAHDQERSFKLSVTSRRIQDDIDRAGLISITHATSMKTRIDEDNEMESDYEHEPIGGISWQDLQVACEDWDVYSHGSNEHEDNVFDGGNQGALYQLDHPPTKASALHSADWSVLICLQKRKVSHTQDILNAPRFVFPSLHDLERATAKLAKTVTLDLNDAQLLIDSDRVEPTVKNSFRKPDLDRGAFTKVLSQRYNISNDEAYDLLKENHQSRIRSTLGNLTVEHSMPAIRLQFPYVCVLWFYLISY